MFAMKEIGGGHNFNILMLQGHLLEDEARNNAHGCQEHSGLEIFAGSPVDRKDNDGGDVKDPMASPTQKIEDIQDIKTPETTSKMHIEAKKKEEEDVDEDEVRLMTAEDLSKAHHLLKHWLSQDQRTAALAHFGTQDVKEAAKDVTKMGQKELQQKFRSVYGTPTHSNNNEWLRRKLYEAIGAAPVKLPSKSRARKNGTKSKKQKMRDADCEGNLLKTERRKRRISARLKDGYSDLPTMRQQSSRRVSRSKSLPSSTMGASVLEMHKQMANDCFTTSASDDDVPSSLFAGKNDKLPFGHSFGAPLREDVSASTYDYPFFDGSSSLPIRLSDDTAEYDLLHAERRKSIQEWSVPCVEQNLQKQTFGLEEDEDMLLPVDMSAYNMVDGLL